MRRKALDVFALSNFFIRRQRAPNFIETRAFDYTSTPKKEEYGQYLFLSAEITSTI